MKTRQVAVPLMAAISLLVPMHSFGGTSIYTDESTFVAATSPTITVDFEDINTTSGRVAFSGNEYQSRGIAFSISTAQLPNGLWIYPQASFWNSNFLSPGAEPYADGDDNNDAITITLNPPVTTFGLRFVDLGGGSGEGIKVYTKGDTLIYDQPYLQGSGIGSGNNPYWGIYSPDRPIARVEIMEQADDGDDVAYDDFRFGYSTTALTHSVSISKTGTGAGLVTSLPGNINCGAACSTKVNAGSTVVLTAAPDSGSVFNGWSGDCSGTDPCVLTMDVDKTVSASFTDTGSASARLHNNGMRSPSFFLVQNNINPFSRNPAITFLIKHPGQVSLRVFNMLGTLISEPAHAWLPAGVYNVAWPHSGLPSGIYFCTLKVDNKLETRKFVMEQ